MLRDASDKHEPVAEAIPALLDVMMVGEADTLVSGTFILEHQVSRGFDFSKLSPALEFNQGGESFWQCPVCGRLYGYEHVVDNEVGASYTMDLFWRTTPEEIGKRLREAALGYEWTWTIK